MREKSKLKTGLKTERTAIQYGIKFSIIERKKIIEDYLSSGKSKQEIWAKYTGRPTEHGSILRWMRTLGYCKNAVKNRKSDENYHSIRTFAVKTVSMQKSKAELEFEVQVLQKRVKALEKQAEESELKAIAFSTMVDLAEKTFNIPVRKKFSTKPSKK
jgi:hypothetical protein